MKINTCSQLIFILLFTVFYGEAIAVNPVNSTVDDQTDLALTINQNNLSLIKDTRTISLRSGRNQLAFEDISALIKPETVILNSEGNDQDFKIMEQSFNYDLLSPKKLLEKYIGRDVKIIRQNPATGEEITLVATVLSTHNGSVFRIGNHLETGMPDRILYPDIPENLYSKPTLVLDLENNNAGKQTIVLHYLSSGLSWKTDYVAKINPAETQINLTAWVTLNNNSGINFNNANIKLVAGNVNQVRNTRFKSQALSRESFAMAEASNVSSAPLMDYQLYSLPNRTSLLNQQAKQVTLFGHSKIPVSKKYRLTGGSHYYRNKFPKIEDKQNASVSLQFNNHQSSNLGISLPQGIVRSYKADDNDQLQFVGESRINHTTVDEIVRLDLGNATNIFAEKKQTDFKILSRNANARLTTESAYEITIHNTGNNNIDLDIEEPIPGDWQVINESLSHKKMNSATAKWKIRIPAHSKQILRYKVKINH